MICMQNSMAAKIAIGIGYLTVEEVEFINELALRLPKDAVCVNIGAGSATSIIAVLEVRSDLTMYSVDINSENGKSQLWEANMLDRVIPVIGDSKEVDWNGGAISYLFVDGQHDYKGLLGDLVAWTPRLAPHAIVMFDDYLDIHWSSVQPLVDEWAKPHKRIGLVNNLIAFEVLP